MASSLALRVVVRRVKRASLDGLPHKHFRLLTLSALQCLHRYDYGCGLRRCIASNMARKLLCSVHIVAAKIVTGQYLIDTTNTHKPFEYKVQVGEMEALLTFLLFLKHRISEKGMLR